MAGSAVMVVFDFDTTIIDCDSDDWIVDQLGIRDVFDRLRPAMQWNPLMDRMMDELHSRGKSIEDIAECLRRAPLDPHVIEAIKTAYSLGCELRVVSDANMFFIETILEHHGLLECFSEINTNPSYVDEEGRLRILPLHLMVAVSALPICARERSSIESNPSLLSKERNNSSTWAMAKATTAQALC